MPRARRRRWRSRALRICLYVWPRRVRLRDGAALVDAALDDLDARAPTRGAALAVTTECLALVRSGLLLRYDALRGGIATTVPGWRAEALGSVRSLRRSPGFTLTVLLAIGIGVGANAVVFGLIDRAVFKPPPYHDPSSLVFVWNTLGTSPDRVRVSAPDAAELARRSTRLSAMAFVSRPSDGGIEVGDGAAVEHVRVSAVTEGLFDLLGIAPSLGTSRGFRTGPGPDGPAATGVAILSYGSWHRVFGADSAIIGRTVRLDGQPIRVVGVMPADFRISMPPDVGMGGAIDVWTRLPTPPAGLRPVDGRQVDQDSDNTGAIIVRLPSGVTVGEAGIDARRVAEALRQEVPGYAEASVDMVVRPLVSDSTAHLRGLLTGLLLGALGLLLVTCLNVSTLSLARGIERRPELALRRSLGATRATLVGHQVTEGVALLAGGTVVAFLLGSAFSEVISRSLPWDIPAPIGAGLDPTTMALSVSLCGGALLLFRLAPGFGQLRNAPRDRASVTRHDRGYIRGALVVTQIAVSVVVTLATALLARAALDLYAEDPGFDAAGAVTFSLSARTPGRFDGPADRARVMRRVTTALAELPRVTHVGLTGHLPLSGRRWTQPYGLPGQSEADWNLNRADFSTVTSGYLEALGVPLLQGRTFTPEEDLVEDRRVVVVDEALARRISPSGRAVGSMITIPLDGSVVRAEVVGVVGRVRHESLQGPGREAVYVPYRQEASREVVFVVRADGDLAALASSIREAVREVDTQLPVFGIRDLSDYVDELVAPTRFTASLVGTFAVLVLLAVAIGLYGIIALEVTRRTREIGVRIAVGAERGTIVRTILGRGARLAGAGMLGGIALSAGLSRVLVTPTPGISATDPLPWVGTLGTVFAVTMLATWFPARRVSRLHPTEALRAD